MRAFVLVLLVGAATSFVDQNEWAAFKDKHGKTYVNPIEEFYRMKVYADNKAYVDKHNAEFAAGKRSFDLALNQFADLTTAEWSATYKGLIMGSTKPHETHELKGNAPSSQDWRQYGIVTGVKNQGQCGSCWSFATTGALEGAYAQAPGNSLTSFSEQQLVDCSGSYGNMGCNGGLMDAAFRYIRDKGITTESEYPYTASQGYCRQGLNIVTELSSYVDIPRGSESSLMDAAGSVGPVAVAIDASHRSFQLYNSGIYDEWACSSTQLDHGVLVVGYGPGYWLVKNSWGTGWGQAGYIQMTRDGSNQCGIATQASYPRL